MMTFIAEFVISLEDDSKTTQEEIEWKLNEACTELEDIKCFVTYKINEI